MGAWTGASPAGPPWGRGMANLVPASPSEGTGARVAWAPRHSAPGLGTATSSQVRWESLLLFGFFLDGGGEGGPGRLEWERGGRWGVVGCARALALAAPAVTGCGSLAPAPPPPQGRPRAPFVSKVAGSPPSHGVIEAPGPRLRGARGLGACGALGCPSAPRGAELASLPASRPPRLGFLRAACSPASRPLPRLEHSPPCALRGRERNGKEERVTFPNY